jgi:hypothetical protein
MAVGADWSIRGLVNQGREYIPLAGGDSEGGAAPPLGFEEAVIGLLFRRIHGSVVNSPV